MCDGSLVDISRHDEYPCLFIDRIHGNVAMLSSIRPMCSNLGRLDATSGQLYVMSSPTRGLHEVMQSSSLRKPHFLAHLRSNVEAVLETRGSPRDYGYTVIDNMEGSKIDDVW